LNTWGMLSPKLDVDIVLLDEAGRQWSCTPFIRVLVMMIVETHSDRGQFVLLSVCFPWSFKFCEAQIDNKACETWLSVSDKPLSLEHLEPLNRCIFLAGSHVAIFLCFYIYTMQRIIKDDECFFILFFYATTASRLMGLMPQIYLHEA
jgi:hypothetical protein